MDQPDSDGFIVIRAKGRRHRNPKTKAQHQGKAQSSLFSTSVEHYDPRKVTRHIKAVLDKKSTLSRGAFHEKLTAILQALHDFGPEETVVYGIGTFSSEQSQWQLALVLLLNQTLNTRILAYDPVLSSNDLAVLAHFGIETISENEQARRTAQRRTLFYMPHCERELYENVVDANNNSVAQLKMIAILGNRLSRYIDVDNGQLARVSPSLCRVLPNLTTMELPDEKLLCLRHRPFAFTDTCFQRILPPSSSSIA
ncbi:hypothetical protein H4S08_002565 [Coemansia sp. RSA 1365]|nr:hypothetical protein H4S08_002565 [Coemansia sp. RSA 1365]